MTPKSPVSCSPCATLCRKSCASHYLYARLPDQFDAVLHFDETRAVEPLDYGAEWEAGEVPETRCKRDSMPFVNEIVIEASSEGPS